MEENTSTLWILIIELNTGTDFLPVLAGVVLLIKIPATIGVMTCTIYFDPLCKYVVKIFNTVNNKDSRRIEMIINVILIKEKTRQW